VTADENAKKQAAYQQYYIHGLSIKRITPSLNEDMSLEKSYIKCLYEKT